MPIMDELPAVKEFNARTKLKSRRWQEEGEGKRTSKTSKRRN